MKTISFRTQLKGAVSDFLLDEEMHCVHTEEGLLELVVALSNYTEEGRQLFPQIILCNDLYTTIKLLQCSDPISIGSGVKNAATILKALKQCAPLANDDWAVFVHRLETEINYGVLRLPYSPISLDIRDTMQETIGETESPNIILATQIADKSVELVGTRSGILNIYLSAMRDDSPSPRKAINDLVESCCVDISDNIRDQVESYLRTTLSIGIHHCHGTLIAVLPYKKKPTQITSDGVLLSAPISLPEMITRYEATSDAINLSSIVAYRNLFQGMLNCDGLVMINTKCQIMGYNLFVKVKRSEVGWN